jgi:hypothetical protein
MAVSMFVLEFTDCTLELGLFFVLEVELVSEEIVEAP